MSSIQDQDQDVWTVAESKATKRGNKSQARQQKEMELALKEQKIKDEEHRNRLQSFWNNYAIHLKGRLEDLIVYLEKICSEVSSLDLTESEENHFHSRDTYRVVVRYWSTLDYHVDEDAGCQKSEWSAYNLAHPNQIWHPCKDFRVQKHLMTQEQRKLADECDNLQRQVRDFNRILLDKKEAVMSKFTKLFDPIDNFLFTANDGSKVLRISRVVQVLSGGVSATQEQRYELGHTVMSYVRNLEHKGVKRVEGHSGKVEITSRGETFEINAYRASHLEMLIKATLEWVVDNLMED